MAIEKQSYYHAQIDASVWLSQCCCCCCCCCCCYWWWVVSVGSGTTHHQRRPSIQANELCEQKSLNSRQNYTDTVSSSFLYFTHQSIRVFFLVDSSGSQLFFIYSFHFIQFEFKFVFDSHIHFFLDDEDSKQVLSLSSHIFVGDSNI